MKWPLAAIFLPDSFSSSSSSDSYNLISSSLRVSGPSPCPAPALGELPGPLVHGRKPVGTRRSE